MWLFVGLGNPGPSYVNNRHNIGFEAIDCVASKLSPHVCVWRSRFQGHAYETSDSGGKLVFLKPQTYMNLSGQSVGDALRFYKMDISRVIVFHDELDLALGKVRVKTGGGHAGHNGLKSISAHCGDGYVRVRLGIGHPGHRDDVSAYVLQNFLAAERPVVDGMLNAVSQNAALLLDGQFERFQSNVAMAMQAQARL